MIWILGRIAWETNIAPTQSQIALAENGDQKTATLAKEQTMPSTIVQTGYPAEDQVSEYRQLAKLDIAKTHTPPQKVSRRRNKQTFSTMFLATKPASATGIATPYHAPVSSGRRNPSWRADNPGKLHPKNAASTKADLSFLTDHKAGAKQSFPLSGYFWLFARKGSSAAFSQPLGTALQPGGAQYGGSQAGAILTFRLVGDQRRNIAIYSRVSSPLIGAGDEEIALGAKVKPLKSVPVSLYAEQRFREGSVSNRGTAVFLAGGTGPDELTTDVFLETYGQAGYVFQDDSSYFFDGSASVQRKLAAGNKAQISVGGALWAGGQEGAQRLDLGPRMNIDLPLGSLTTRVSVDWRQRVAGNAQPGSGLAVSLSTGF